MKRKLKILLPTFSLCVFVVVATASVGEAQNLQTSDANQTQVYGQWVQPSNTNTNNQTELDPVKDRFRELFPPTKLQPISHRITNRTVPNRATTRPDDRTPDNRTPDDRTANRYPLSQQPAPMAETLPKARPLQPISQSNFIQGRFSQEPNPGGDFARVNHHEASTAEGVMPLPRSSENSDWSIAPKIDSRAKPAPSPTWIDQPIESNQTSSELQNIVGSVQSTGKDIWSQFQTNGGWGEKIAGFFGGGDDRIKRVFGSLAVVIGGYLAFVWLMRKFNLSSNRGIPSEVIEVIGNAPFGPRKNLQLVRLGSKLLLLMSGPEGTHPVGEITDAEEVDYLISLCNGKATRATGSVMSAIGKMSRRNSTPQQTPGRTVHPSSPAPTEAKFSAAQLVQALETIQGSHRNNTVFEA